MKCSVGIFAYNEEKNIGRLLQAILNQELNEAQIEEIFVIADGCSDKTVEISQEFIRQDSRIKVLAQKVRQGKSMAVNNFLEVARNEILIIEGGDTLPEKNAIENLIKPFLNPNIGMTGARPVPTDNPKTFMGFATHLLWQLHHQISLKTPKMGEIIAFRKIFDKIPPTAVDEAYIEGFFKKRGYQILYIPQAIVYNKGPENIQDFLRQRRRIFWGHFHLKKEFGYQVATINITKTLYLIFKNCKFNFRYLFFTPLIIILEGLARFLGWLDYMMGKSHLVWKVAESTKNLKINH